jgi:uroporphyrin-3 C-methyltransferase
MSKTDKDEPQADATFDEALADTSFGSIEMPPKKRAASASIAWLAMFLSLIAIAGVGYLLLDNLRKQDEAEASSQALATLQRQLDASSQSIDTLLGNITDLSDDDSQAAASIADLRRDIERRAELLDSLPPRMSNLERSVAALQGVSIEARNTYLVAEAEYYMQIANAQLQLAGNPYLASLALEQADDRLLQLADPALTSTRASIADELAALDGMEKPDIAGATLMLASLARVVDSLPMRSAASKATADVGDGGDGELSGAARAWDAVKDAASDLIRVTPPDAERVALITPDIAEIARSNLALLLQAARLALLRGEPEIFQQSLDDADDWIETYFDTESQPVRSARQTMAEIRSEYAAVVAPDISQSLRLLRQYKTLAEPAQ